MNEVTCTLMITLSVNICNPISQKTYDNIISTIPFYSLKCTCGLSGLLIGHGSYPRSIKIEGSKTALTIQRVRCKACDRTHAILLSSMIPYSQISLEDQLDIIKDDSIPKGQKMMERNPSIDENNVQSILLQFQRHWKQKILSQGISLALSSDLVQQCFCSFNRQFMQIKTTPNILFLRPT